MNPLSVCDAAYLAGIIDGEGTITLTCKHRGENRRPVLSISSTEPALLRYARAAIGAGRITSKACSRPHHSPSFAYVITGRQALAVLSHRAVFAKLQAGTRPTTAGRVCRINTAQRTIHRRSARQAGGIRASIFRHIDTRPLHQIGRSEMGTIGFACH